MNNNEIISHDSTIAAQENSYDVITASHSHYPNYDDEQHNKVIDEIIYAIKDDRINTKHAISAEIASSARAQNQNERAITACEKELRRNDLSTSQRQELINRICSAAESTSQINIESRDFINSQIEKSHKLPFQIVGLFTLITIGGLCGHALLRKAA